MAKKTHVGLNYTEIRDKYPMSVEKLKDWVSKTAGIANGLREEELIDAVDKIVPMMVQYNARSLYEFFDDQNIIIYIGFHPDSRERFVYVNSKTGYSRPAENRIEAEEGAFIDAFDTLE